MRITKKSPLTDKENTMELDITEEQVERWRGGELAQYVFPHLSDDEREFLISGCYPGEYEQLCGHEDEDEYYDFDLYDEPAF